MSALWRHIHVDVENLARWVRTSARRSGYCETLMSRMKAFAELSKSQPLSIQLDWGPHDHANARNDPAHNGLRDILASIITWAPERLTKLLIQTTDLYGVWHAIGQQRYPCNQLLNVETFMVLQTGEFDAPEHIISGSELDNVSQMFPKLRHLWLGDQAELDGNFLTRDSLSLRVPEPFCSLTTMYFRTEFSLEQAINLLTMCPRLEWVSLQISGICDDGNMVPPRVAHENLKEMHLTVTSVGDTEAPILQVFSKIRFPKLTLLRLNLETPFMTIDSTSNQELQDRFHPRQFIDTFPSLQTLEVYTSEWDYHDGWMEPFFHSSSIIPLLLSAPSITVFSFASWAQHLGHIIPILQFIKQSDTSVLPNLQSLYIGYRNRARDMEEGYEDIEALWVPPDLGATYSPSGKVIDSESASLVFGRLAKLKHRVRIIADYDSFDKSPLMSFEQKLRRDYNMDIPFEVINSRAEDASTSPCHHCLISDVPPYVSYLNWYSNTHF
ncbi:hypothetical protein CVT24_011199 [Panaeolus cyanescens]|uniref:F-box domain-containing protein n=1 Tax=Panaeolus cyanescens TaxID=181874 RepID=A0A409VI61_9AGAR|nr:hypothetical protein CVT24_011199 [Panaeolus cyanescens]